MPEPISSACAQAQVDKGEDRNADGLIAATPCLTIVGKNTLLNHLLKVYLEKEMPSPCTVQVNSTWNQFHDEQCEAGQLILFDCYGLTASDLWIKIGFHGLVDPTTFWVALFNICDAPDIEFERQAIEKQVRGVFYHTEPLDLLARGITKILGGEIWFSRKTTSTVLMEHQHFRHQTEAAEAMLTLREKEILIAIAAGSGNGDIAEELRISLHTVKSHIYNIYKKIDVRNRLEATLWVARYL